MADRCILTRSKRLLNNSVQKLNFKDDIKQIDCTNLIYDGKRFKWTSSWERLKNFVEETLELNGRWVSPGGSARKFTCSNLDLSVTWYPGKQNSLILQGKLSIDLTNLLIACQKKTGKSIVEIDASPMNNLNDNGSEPTTSAVNSANNPSVVPVYKSLSGAMLGTDKCQSESACLKSQCNLQCDCKCGILAAELEGIKLDMVIMQRNIESNSRKANIAQEEEVKRLEKELANEREKNRQLETDITILVKGRDAEISELNNIIASLQNKLEARETLINQSPMLGSGYINMHRLDGTKEFLSSSETKVCLLKQYLLSN